MIIPQNIIYSVFATRWLFNSSQTSVFNNHFCKRYSDVFVVCPRPTAIFSCNLSRFKSRLAPLYLVLLKTWLLVPLFWKLVSVILKNSVLTSKKTLHLVNAVSGNNRCLLWEPFKTNRLNTLCWKTSGDRNMFKVRKSVIAHKYNIV